MVHALPVYVRCTVGRKLGLIREQISNTFMALARFPCVVGTPNEVAEKSDTISGVHTPGIWTLTYAAWAHGIPSRSNASIGCYERESNA